jgi:FixJ family two-component response regulator
MPGMSSFDLRRLLVSRNSNVPVIMITARVEPDLESRAAASDVACLLRKPFETNALIGCLENALKV